MQPINFYDDSDMQGRPREEVRINQLGIYVYEDGRRIAVGFNITPFRERPSIEVTATNARGEVAGSMSIIEAMTPNFNVTMHLRDDNPTDGYEIQAILYYQPEDGDAEGGRLLVDRKSATIDISRPGEHVVG